MPSIFPNNSADLNLQTSESTENAHDLIISSLPPSNEPSLEESWPFNSIDLESDNNSDEGNHSDTSADIILTKEKYEELLDKSVELFKCQHTILQLKAKLKENSMKTKELKKVITSYEYLLKKKETVENLELAENNESQQKDANQCNVSVAFN